jgi:DNA-directed RNA polymerase subunit H (RpoH/RPB5)
MEQAKLTVIEMFQQRGYDTPDNEDDQIIAIKQDGHQICAFFGVFKFNGDKAREIISSMNTMGVNHSIVVYQDSVTPAAKKINRDLENMEIELFSEEELQYNITHHRLQPKFELLSENEAVNLKKNYGSKFSTMLRSDAISRFHFYQRGDIVKVTRKGGYVDYRLVRG